MLNNMYRSDTSADGVVFGITGTGARGHAVYGPYKTLKPGNYIVEFDVFEDEVSSAPGHTKVGIIDIASHTGQAIHSKRDILLSEVRAGNGYVRHAFSLTGTATYECRFYVTGAVSLRIGGSQRIIEITDGVNADTAVKAARFPNEDTLPAFLADNLVVFKTLYNRGALISVQNDAPVVTIEGVSFYGRQSDDLLFVGELFWEKIYQFFTDQDCCVIDVGMNVGLTTMQMAQKSFVKQVHSFEPFKATYDRAVDNISLNPHFKSKITTYNFGLAGKSETLKVRSWKSGDSGMNSMRDGDGEVQTIEIREASSVLAPIIRNARANGLTVIAKIDCEGAEFSVFESLEKLKLFKEISVVMLEYHPVHETLTKYDLADTLTANGFIVFNPSPDTGNGMMYAVRAASNGRS